MARKLLLETIYCLEICVHCAVNELIFFSLLFCGGILGYLVCQANGFTPTVTPVPLLSYLTQVLSDTFNCVCAHTRMCVMKMIEIHSSEISKNKTLLAGVIMSH